MKSSIAITNGTASAFSIEAEIIEICGFNCGVHRNLKNNGWACTSIGTGIALAVTTGGTKAQAVALATSRIETAGVAIVAAKLAEIPLLPDVSTLKSWNFPSKDMSPEIDVTLILEEIAKIAGLNGVEKAAVSSALCWRGRGKGRLLAKCPTDDWGKAAWNGIQPNAFKIQFTSCFLRGGPAELLTKLAKYAWPDWLDKDKQALKNLGVW